MNMDHKSYLLNIQYIEADRAEKQYSPLSFTSQRMVVHTECMFCKSIYCVHCSKIIIIDAPVGANWSAGRPNSFPNSLLPPCCALKGESGSDISSRVSVLLNRVSIMAILRSVVLL